MGCITNPDLQDLCLQIIHTRSALHISFDVCNRGMVPGAQKLNLELGEVFNRFCQGFPRWEGTDGFLLPPPGAALKCGSGKMAPSFSRGFAAGIYGKVGLFSWHEKEVLSLFLFFTSWHCKSN